MGFCDTHLRPISIDVSKTSIHKISFEKYAGIRTSTSLMEEWVNRAAKPHYNYVIMGAMASQITSLKSGYLTVYSGAEQRKHQSSASLVFVRGIHRRPVNSPHKGPVTRKMFPYDGVIMLHCLSHSWHASWMLKAKKGPHDILSATLSDVASAKTCLKSLTTKNTFRDF